MPLPGEIRKMMVSSCDSNGAWLENGDEPVFLPAIDCPSGLVEGDKIEVFLFQNRDHELEATTQIPEITLHKAGSVRIKTVSPAGAFASIGSKRDVIIPEREQRKPLSEGDWTVMILKYDRLHNRLFGSTRIQYFLKKARREFKPGDQVDVLIYERIENARKVIVNDTYNGIIFDHEMLFPIRVGDRCKAYVRKIEGDMIVLGMEKSGIELLLDAKERIVGALQDHRGYLRLTDQSDPEEIKLRLKMSKKTFKKAVGMLLKEGKVVLTKRGVKLAKEGDGDDQKRSPNSAPSQKE